MTAPLIGAMRHRLSLEAASRTGDGGGGAAETWEPIADVWAAIDPISGDEATGSESVRGRVSHAIHIRHRAGIAPSMRFRSGARVFEILAVIDIGERRRRLRCLCRERDL